MLHVRRTGALSAILSLYLLFDFFTTPDPLEPIVRGNRRGDLEIDSVVTLEDKKDDGKSEFVVF